MRKNSIADGVYLKGSINGTPIIFTADTSASRTIISSRVYESLSKETILMLEEALCLVGAGGKPIRKTCKAKFKLMLGPLEIEREAVVAEIEKDALLGYDILKGDEDGPADIPLSRNMIILQGAEIPIFQVGHSAKTRRVTVAEDVNLPGLAETVESVYVDRFEGILRPDFIVEPPENTP